VDLRRLRAGEWLAALSGIALLASLFLPWYGPGGPQGFFCIAGYGNTIARGGFACGNVSGWESLTAIDVLLAFVAASGVLLAIVTANQRVPAVPVALSALVALFGAVGFVLVLIRALDLPNWTHEREWGLWLALAGAAGIVAGSVLSMREEIRPGEGSVHVETLPAPGP
jgi:hypothetical protein